jgi:hypothetical protein
MKPASALKSVYQVINTAKAPTLPLRGGGGGVRGDDSNKLPRIILN